MVPSCTYIMREPKKTIVPGPPESKVVSFQIRKLALAGVPRVSGENSLHTVSLSRAPSSSVAARLPLPPRIQPLIKRAPRRNEFSRYRCVYIMSQLAGRSCVCMADVAPENSLGRTTLRRDTGYTKKYVETRLACRRAFLLPCIIRKRWDFSACLYYLVWSSRQFRLRSTFFIFYFLFFFNDDLTFRFIYFNIVGCLLYFKHEMSKVYKTICRRNRAIKLLLRLRKNISYKKSLEISLRNYLQSLTSKIKPLPFFPALP